VCGIYGIVDRGGLRHGDPALLAALARNLEHRGPDGGDQFAADRAAIGMRRLSIIDLAGGMQPLWNERRTIALVANGEVYDFVERRKELESRGHRFATGSDCEVIVHLYEELGSGCLERLRGMFAFALLDLEKRTVLIARDRLGEKPLYLAERGDRIVFASELQSLVGAGVVPFALDEAAVLDYFMWDFVPEPRSAVLGTRKLPAGSCLEISLDPWQVRERRWWSILDSPPEIAGDPGEHVAGVLDEVGRLIVRSDVPIGVALSSGIDSSMVASLARRNASGEVHAFTVGYEGSSQYDESALAAEYAGRLGIRHHRVRLEKRRVVEDFARMCRARDEPISDITGPAYLALMEASRAAGVPVLIFGQGGDELFWGYPWTIEAVRDNLRKIDLLAGRAGLPSYLRLRRPPRSYGEGVTWALHAAGLVDGVRAWRRDRTSPPGQMVFWDRHASWRRAEAGLRDLASPGFLKRVGGIRPERHFTYAALPERPDLAITDLLVRTYLLCNGINQADRLSMAASVECRLPLVDYRLVETVIGLRRRLEDWKLPRRRWLRDAVEEHVPREIFDRRKRGFTPPWRGWTQAIFDAHGEHLRSGVLAEMDVVRRLDRVPSPFDPLGRPAQVMMPALMLEAWARGMRELERSQPAPASLPFPGGRRVR